MISSRRYLLIPYDPETNAGVPDKVIKHYDDMKNPTHIMTKEEMIEFHNSLRKKNNHTQQVQNFLFHLNGSKFIIYCNGIFLSIITLSRKIIQKCRKEFIEVLPILEEWGLKEWFLWYIQMQKKAYHNYLQMPSFHLQVKRCN